MKKIFIVFALLMCAGYIQAQKTKNDPKKLSTDLVKVLLESIPSPLETCILLKDTGAKYDSTLLNHHYNVEHYDTHYKRALNFGVCLTDFGYASLYGESQATINTITSIREMSQGLKIDEAFEFDDIGKMLNNKIGLTEGFTSITGKIFPAVVGVLALATPTTNYVEQCISLIVLPILVLIMGNKAKIIFIFKIKFRR